MSHLKGYIERGLSYLQVIKEPINFVPFNEFYINQVSKVITEIYGETMAICRWVSPKRTRSYPYARVYDILSQDACKKVAVIPVVKDEGKRGDRDFLQWDTIALLSLLNVYIIPAYYCDASRRGDKITKQKFDTDYIKTQLENLSSYKSTALHWNIGEFKRIADIIQKVKSCYEYIARRLNTELHSFEGLEKYEQEMLKSIEDFIYYSRHKSYIAQNREVNTIQPKERVEHKKAKIDIINYLGGMYHFTVDEFILKNDTVWLIESKHSQTSLLPNKEDVKDGLLKIMLYKSINRLELDGNKVNFCIALKLTSSKAKNKENLTEIIETLRGERHKDFYRSLIKEAFLNDFEVFYHATD